MALAADRVKAMRALRRARGPRELRLNVSGARSRAGRRRVATQVASSDRARVVGTRVDRGRFGIDAAQICDPNTSLSCQ